MSFQFTEGETVRGSCHTVVTRLVCAVSTHLPHARNLSVLTFVSFVTAGIGFITQVAIANKLGKAEFGFIAYALVIATYGSTFVRCGLDRTLVRDLVHQPDRLVELVKASLVLRWVLLLIVVLGVLLWKLVVGNHGGISWGMLLIIVGNTMMSLDLQPVYDSWRRMSRHAIYNLFQRCLYFAMIWLIILIAPAQLGVLWIGAATCVSVVVYLFLQHSWAMARLHLLENQVKSELSALRLARDNVPVWIAAIGALLIANANQLVLKRYSGPDSLGIYAAAWQVITIAVLMFTQVGRIGNPRMADITRELVSREERVQFLAKYVGVMLLVTSPVALACIFVPNVIVSTMFSAEYVDAQAPLRILGVYSLVFSTGIVLSQYVISARMQGTYLMSTLLGGVLSIAVASLLVPRHGVIGAALSLLISHSVSIAVHFCAACIDIARRGERRSGPVACARTGNTNHG